MSRDNITTPTSPRQGHLWTEDIPAIRAAADFFTDTRALYGGGLDLARSIASDAASMKGPTISPTPEAWGRVWKDAKAVVKSLEADNTEQMSPDVLPWEESFGKLSGSLHLLAERLRAFSVQCSTCGTPMGLAFTLAGAKTEVECEYCHRERLQDLGLNVS